MVRLLIPLTLFTIMGALGLSLRPEALGWLRHRPALVIRVLVGSTLLMPLLALLLLRSPVAAGFTPSVVIGIALMALCPSAPLTLRKAYKKGGNRELAAILQVCAAIAAIGTIPLMADLYRSSFGVAGWNITPLEVAHQVAKAQLLPLGIGVLVRRLAPGLANRLEGPLDRLASALLLLLTILVLVKVLPLLIPFVRGNAPALLVVAALVLAALGIGFALSGPGGQERTTIALVTSMRNPGLALLLASTYAPDKPAVKLVILLYLLTTFVLSTPFLRWLRQQQQLGGQRPQA